MKVLDLFSGIGGFSLGLERAGMTTVAFCEIEPFCRRVLAKHWPGVPILDDVRTTEFPAADIVAGGFPCQDISHAGGGAGLAGERSGLWRELLRAIRLVRPKYAIVENVAALLGRGMGTVVGDLAQIRYDAEWHCIPASALGFEHDRDRCWIIANPHSERELQLQGRVYEGGGWAGDGTTPDAADLDAPRYPRRSEAESHREDVEILAPRLRSAIDAAPAPSREHWNHQPVLGRGLHGVSDRVDRIGALGNAVVPQIPEIIGRAILRENAQSELKDAVPS